MVRLLLKLKTFASRSQSHIANVHPKITRISIEKKLGTADAFIKMAHVFRCESAVQGADQRLCRLINREPLFKKVEAQTIVRGPPLPERNVARDQSSNYRDKGWRERLNVEHPQGKLARFHQTTPHLTNGAQF